MTEQQARQELGSILDQLQVNQADNIMLGIDMGKLPLPAYPAAMSKEAFRERGLKWCRFIMDVLTERLGSEGSLLVPAYSYSCGRPDSIFRSESTPSEVGPFTEFFRQQPGVIRSLHPLFSIAGTGRHAAQILQNAGYSAFGSTSPFARFAEFRVKFLCLGVELRNSVTYVHHLEQCNGSPHRFSKLFKTVVYDGGNKVEGPWSAYVAYRGMNYTSDISSLQQGLATAPSFREARWNGHMSQVAGIEDVDNIGNKLLMKDPFAFVNRRLYLDFNDGFDANLEKKDISRLEVTATGYDHNEKEA